MSGDDQVNATTLLQGSRVLFLTQDGNQSVGLNSYVDAPTNAVMGLVIFDELNDPPNQTRISINNQGITETFANGDPTLNVSWSNFYLLKEATQALRLPITANILVANDTIEANDNNLAKTRIASMSAVASVNPQLTLKADTGGAVWEEADLTQNGLTYTTSAGSSSSATWANIIAGGGGVPDIDQVLQVGQNANNQPITNLNGIGINGGTNLYNNSLAFVSNGGAITDLFSINGQQYYPYSGNIPDINAVLGAGNSANSQSITGLVNVDLQTINNSSYPPSFPNLQQVLAVSNYAGNQDIVGVNNINTTSINGVYYPPYPIAPYGLTQTLAYSNDGGGLGLTNVSGISSVNGTFTIASQNSGAIDINSSYDTNMNGTGTFTINNGNGVNIYSSNAIQIISSSSSATLQANQNISVYSSNGSITLEVVNGYIYLYGLPTSSGGPANSLYNAGGILMIN